MTKSDETALTMCVLGVAGSNDIIELYGINRGSAVVVHGWFQQSTGFAVLAGRSPCLIAVDALSLPDECVSELRRRGHTVIILPPTVTRSRSAYRRTAKDMCQLAMGLAAQDCSVQKYVLQ